MSHTTEDYTWIHIPKTAGKSLSVTFGGICHRTIREMVRDNPAALGTYKFTFVRHPADRLLSAYHWCQTGEFKHDAPTLDPSGMSAEIATWPFQKWLLAVCDGVVPNLIFTWPMVRWTNLDGINIMNFVGRFEDLQADYAALCDRLDIHAELVHWHKTEHAPWRKVYTTEMRRRVELAYAIDFETFNY